MSRGIIYVYEDGGKFCGEWEDDQAHGHGVCTGPQGMGTFEGLWERGDQVSGVFMWPTGQKYTGKWKKGLRDGLGKESKPDGTEYVGEFTRDLRGPYGVLQLSNGAVYRGTWSGGVQDGEGVETYIDGGVYRGQYKNGVRHGHGTRSSAAYERDPRSTTNVSSASEGAKKISVTSISSDRWTKETNGGSRLSNAVAVTRTETTMSLESSAQIYEGEWKDDKRHGHGVLKVPGHRTYYGQWEENTKTGYGVLLYNDGRKEEGQWQNGKLINTLKRKKALSLRNHNLEGKVKLAHITAIQMSITARSKAELAESRASSASAKFQSVQKCIQQAVRDAQTAREKASMCKNAPRVAEALKSPVHDLPMELPPVSPRLLGSIGSDTSSSTDSPNLLQLSGGIPPSASYEDIGSISENSSKRSSLPRNYSNSSSLGSTPSTSELSLSSRQSREDTERDRELRQRKSQLQHRNNSGSMEDRESVDSLGASSSISLGGPEQVKMKRQHLLRMATMSDRSLERQFNSYGSRPELPHHSSDEGIHLQKDMALSEYEEEAEDRGISLISDSALKSEAGSTRRVDKTTGERGHGDVSDDESPELNTGAANLGGQRSRTLMPPPPRPLVTRPSITMDMLVQMANWNKMVACINFALLIFLLILIVVFVISIHFHFSSQSSMPQNPAAFMTPMA